MASSVVHMSEKKKKASNPAPARSNVAVAIRVRPTNDQEVKDTIVVRTDPVDRSVHIRTKIFNNFERVYGPSSLQSDIYRELVKKQVEDVLRGYNCTIFAYGQTGTGKTYTMEGGEGSIEGDWETDECTGIIPRSAQHIFSELSARDGIEYIVRLSYVEIYNEEMIDLLGSTAVDEKQQHIRLFEDPAKKGSIVISGAEEVPVRCRDDVYRLLKQGTEKRRTAETLMNKRSSRSHSVLTISVLIREQLPTGEELVKQGKLRLVDLAGSENIGRSGAEGKRAKEAGNINTSLLALGRVINALTTNGPHVPYRESKLTRLLQDSLGGSSITTIIATLSPTNSNYEESISTLEYAHRAMNIKNKPEVNENVNKKDLFKEYAGQMERLMRELKAAREKNGVYLDQEQYDDMDKKMETQKETIASLEEQLENTLELIKKHMADISLMDQYYGKAYCRVRSLEERLALRVDELEETKLAMAKEQHEHDLTKRALNRSRLHADEAFSVATGNNEIGWEAIQELQRIHPRVDCIIEFANENKERGEELARSIDSIVPPMREENEKRMKDGEESVHKSIDAVESLKVAVSTEIPTTRTSIDTATESVESALTRLDAIDGKCEETIETKTKELIELIENGKASIEFVIHSALTRLARKSEEAVNKVEEMEKKNEEMRKEMETLRADARGAIESAQKKRRENREEMEMKKKEMMEMMTSWMESVSTLNEKIESEQMEKDEKVAETLQTMGDVEMGWTDQTDEMCEELKSVMKESNEKTYNEISSCIPTLVGMVGSTEEYGKKNGESIDEWKKERTIVKGEMMEKHCASLATVMTSINNLTEIHSKTREITMEELEKINSTMMKTKEKVNEDMKRVEKIVKDEIEKMNEILPKDEEQTIRVLKEMKSAPTEEELYGEEEEEERGEGDEENGERDTFQKKKQLRRSRFRVRDSILVAREELHSPNKILSMRQRVEEESEDTSFD
ncbi:hypothetical protein PFISCL1PPCAC_5836 [Pristionchus fissidentatus]|uniref:Kinesin-like protein n=1 Tax=Pristionchus fissidentatus TaxID=1538716 RepID=A0AAV5V521_9BILA|nr:hypothetical protein PFISCL1PPCAC_5836 [Pristionchus fissidentatus]